MVNIDVRVGQYAQQNTVHARVIVQHCYNEFEIFEPLDYSGMSVEDTAAAERAVRQRCWDWVAVKYPKHMQGQA